MSTKSRLRISPWVAGASLVLTLALLTPCSVVHAQDGSLLRAQPSPYQVVPPTRLSGNGAVVPPQGIQGRQTLTAQNAAPPVSAAGELPAPQSMTPAPRDITLQEASWFYQPPSSTRVYRLNDIVTIRVDEIARMTAEGNAESRRNTLYDALLSDWLQFDGIDSIKPAQQEDGDQRIRGSNNQLYRADSSLEARQSFSFNIAARVVDIRPNGDLVLEARKTIEYNDNAWETALTGICRPVDIAGDNVVLSRDLLDLQINSRERGRLNDGYKRGWLSKLVDTINPF